MEGTAGDPQTFRGREQKTRSGPKIYCKRPVAVIPDQQQGRVHHHWQHARGTDWTGTPWTQPREATESTPRGEFDTQTTGRV